MKTALTTLLALTLAPAVFAAERVGDPAAEKPLVVVYPFISDFDEGALGAKTRECIRGHALRSKKLTSFDQISENELLAASPIKPSPAGKLEKVADHARENFKARYAIWGQLKKSGKGYKLRVLGAIIDAKKPKDAPGAKVLADETYDCPNVHHIPQHAETFIAKLMGTDRRNLERKFAEVVKVVEEIDINGDFSKAGKDGDWPARWSLVRSDLKPQTSWEPRDKTTKANKCLRYRINKKTAATYGIATMSDHVKVVPGAYYQASLEIKSLKPKVIFWVKGYTKVDGEMRETFRHQVRFYPEKKKQWERLTTKPFKPRNPLVKIDTIRLMLYGYHPAGEVAFDNAWLKRVQVTGDKEPAPAFVKEGGGEKLQ